MIKVILFDLDGVLTTDATGTISLMNYIDFKTNIQRDVFEKAYRKHNYNLLYGLTSHDKIWSQVCEEINENINMTVLSDAFINTPMDVKMIFLVKQLKASGYRVGMITDNKADRVQKILSYNGLDELFEAVIISSDIGSGKKEHPIFNETIKIFDETFESCVFIDNNKNNLKVPSELGMHTIYFDHEKRDHERLLEQLNRLMPTTILL